MSRLLIISPHLDDAVLSCGGRIAMATERGAKVLVTTCFTSPGETAPSSLQQHYQQRRADDIRSLKLLGADILHLGLTDAPFRDVRYHNFNTILFHHQLPDEETSLVTMLAETLRKVAIEWAPDEILLPLGVGGHIDHHVVWEAGRSLVDEWNSDCLLTYYEDLPYALLPGWRAVRWRALGGKAIPGKAVHDKAPPIDLLTAPYPFIRNYINTDEDRMLSVEKYGNEFAGLKNDQKQALEWAFDNRLFVYNLSKLDDHYSQLKCRAVTLYSTEWRVLFGESINTELYTESSWRLKTIG